MHTSSLLPSHADIATGSGSGSVNNATPSTVAALAAKHRLKFLIIEESEGVRRIYGSNLQDEGHSVVKAANGIEGLYAFKESLREAVKSGDDRLLCDVVLISPLTSGWTVAQTVAGLRQGGMRGIVMFNTSNVRDVDPDALRACGVDCIVGRPLRIKKFQKSLDGEWHD